MKKLEDLKLSALYIIRKDHDNESLKKALVNSQSSCVKKAASPDNVPLF